MTQLIKQAILKRKITLFVLVILICFGVYNYIVSPRQETPEIEAPMALITAIYPGASPDDIESLVTEKIEDELSKIEGYDYAYSYSHNNIGVVIVRFEYDTDLVVAFETLRQKMSDLQSELPDECQAIEVNTDLVETAGMIISMSSEKFSYEELADYAERFQRKLAAIDGIAKFDIDGKQEKELVIEIDYKKLNLYNLSYNNIVQLLRAQNIEIPSGSVGSKSDKVKVKVSGKFESIEDIENIIIAVSSKNRSTARLKDIADIKFELADSNYKIIHNGENAILLTGYFKKNRNIVVIGKEVDKVIKNLSEKLPEGINFNTILNQPETVDKSVRSFVWNLIQGVIFVVIVVFIGMGLRNAIIVSTAIPSSILITFAIMNLMSINIHQISIAALIVSLGMLVDNAIVVSDSIQVRLDRDENRFDACLYGTKEVMIPILTSTLTTIAAFLPLLLLNSIAGEYISSLPTIVMIALVVSYMVAMFVTPSMAFIFFKKSKKKVRKYFFRTVFDNLLLFGMKKKYLVIGFMLLIFSLTVFVGSNLGLLFFPFADTDLLYIEIKSEKISNIDATEELVFRVVDVVEKDELTKSYTVSIGDGLPKFYQTMPVATPSQDYAQMMVHVDLSKIGKNKEYESLTQYINVLQDKMNLSVYGGTVTVKQLEQGEPIGAPIVIRVAGDNLDEIGELSKKVSNILKGIEGSTNVKSDFDDYSYEFFVDANRERAGFFGISKYDIQNEISIALYGREAGVFKKNSKEYIIKVKSNISDKDELENLGIKSSMAPTKVLLKNISDIKTISSLPVIRKYNRELTVTIYSDVKFGYSPINIQNELYSKLADLELNGMTIESSGEKEKIKQNFGEVGGSAVLAIVLVYIILLIQFDSMKQPFVILLTIPLSTFGSVVGLYLARQPLSFTAILGIVSLLGIVVNNAIVLVDFINIEITNGSTIPEACFQAVDKRFRPIMLSTITTVIGLTPLVYSGGELFVPMAISLMSGLIVSTVFTLVVIPVVYSIFIKDKNTNKNINTKISN